jgi:hypothetical protein
MIGIAIAIALTAASGSSVACVSDPPAANHWVRLIDLGRWDESWVAAAALFQARVPQQGWVSTIRSVREPLGRVSSRTVRSVTKATSLPGAPDGQYKVVQFLSRFENKNGATETVVLACENATWKVSGYFIR